MVGDPKVKNWRVLVFAGMVDFAVGVGLMCAGLTGVLGADSRIFALVGAVLAVVGVGIALFARNKMSQGSGPGGRLD